MIEIDAGKGRAMNDCLPKNKVLLLGVGKGYLYHSAPTRNEAAEPVAGGETNAAVNFTNKLKNSS